MENEILNVQTNNVKSDFSKVHDLTKGEVYEEISFDENVSKVISKKEARAQKRALAKEQKEKQKADAHAEMYFENDAQARRFVINRRIKLFCIYFFLTIAAFFTLVPFYWMLITSFKDYDELIRIPATFFPMEPTFANYLNVFSGENSILMRYILNTIIVAVSTMVLSVVTTTLAAFAFSRLEFKGRDTLFAILLATMMVPGEMMIMTNFTTVATWGLLDTYIALILPFGTSVFYMFFLRQNFKQIPNELYYAAKVDGNSDFKYLFRVMIPIARPALITVIILSMIGSWNAYIWPRTVSQGENMKLITDGIMTLFSNDFGGDTSNIKMAATTVVSIPLLLAFAFFKKYIMRGVSRSGIKG